MIKYPYLWIGSIAFVLGVGLALLPVTQQNILTRGVDRFENHRPIFGSIAQSQDVEITRELRGVGALVVNLRRAETLEPVTVTVTDPETNAVLRQTTLNIDKGRDDVFTVGYFDEPLYTSNPVKITFSSAPSTNSNAVGIRFHHENPYPFSSRFEHGQYRPGDLAIVLIERVPFWRYVVTTLIQHPLQARNVALALAIVGLLLVLIQAPIWHKLTRRQRHLLEIAIIVLLAVIAVGVRFILLPQFHGVSGGDPYNYLFITQKIAALENPFEGVKRLPGYPLLLLPAFLTPIDDIWWMRFLSIISAGSSMVLLSLLAKSLKLPWQAQLVAPFLLLLHKDFLWTSLRPEPYTVYTFLLLASLVLWFNLHSWWLRVLFGLCLGYAAMTRQEGFVLAALLGIASIIFWRPIFNLPAIVSPFSLKYLLPSRAEITVLIQRFSVSFAPAFLLVLPFFANNTIAFGNPLYTPYFEGERLQIVDSWPAFLDSLGATWGILSSTWRPIWDELYRVPVTDPLFITTCILVIAWVINAYWQLDRRYSWLRYVLIGFSLGGLMLATMYIIGNEPRFNYVVMTVTAAVTATMVLPFMFVTGWRGNVVVLVALSQILIALWFHPFPKHYQQAYPLLMLGLATVVTLPAVYQKKQIGTAMSTKLDILSHLTLLVPLTVVAISLLGKTTPAIDEYNQATALDHVVYQAVKVALQQPGPHGFDQAYLQARLYFIDQASYFGGDEEHSPEERQAWLSSNQIKTLVVTNSTAAFADVPATWRKIKSFKSEGRKEFLFTSTIYELP